MLVPCDGKYTKTSTHHSRTDTFPWVSFLSLPKNHPYKNIISFLKVSFPHVKHSEFPVLTNSISGMMFLRKIVKVK
jgi:hypothetical protein